jgi:DNA-binding winged helix-turn-helix (wHTH) protein/tetratricopeptide (TPR) repeat protein/Cdc6-like AAA superfamily ATPase
MESLRLRFDTFELDEADARLRRAGQPIALAPRAFAVLCTLARTPGQLVTKDALLDAVWGHRHVSESVLKTTISELRTALEDDARQPRYIETASRRGYRFIGAAAAPANAAPGATPVPAAVAGFIGREAELAELRDAWRRAQSGERQLVWVSGEAGVGKTTLINSFVNELGADVATFGQCIEHFGTGEPYLPILEAVKELCRRDPRLVASMRNVAPTWLVQMPWLVSAADRAHLYTDVGGAHQDRMVREMRELMDRFTAHRPLVFVLEDLHWSDVGTLRMMEHFARRPREVRLLWIATFRLTQVIAEEHPLRQLRQELRLHKLCREIQLDPFSESEVASYLAARLPEVPVGERFVRRLHAHTDGLPLFLRNVTESLLAHAGNDAAKLRGLTQAESDVPLPVPDSLAGVIEKQMARLPDSSQAVLRAASVLGMEFRASLVAALLGREIDSVCDELDALVRRQLWVRLAGIDELADGGIDPRYAFLHALYKHVLYERISLPQRVQLHRKAGATLGASRAAGVPVAAAELASHAERGHQYVPALRFYGEAVDHAVAHFAPNDALNLTALALRLLERVPTGAERDELELALVHRRGVAAGQLHGIGAPDTVQAFERTRELCDALPVTPMRALLLSGLGLTRYVCGDYAAALALADRVLAVGDAHDDDALRTSGALLSGMVRAARGEHAAACAMLEAGIAACGRLGQVSRGLFVVDPFTQLHSNIAVPLMALGRGDDARRHIAAAQARAQSVGQPTARMLSLWVDGMINVRAENPPHVLACATTLTDVVDKSMLMQGGGPARWLRGWATSHLGDPATGYRLIREGYALYEGLGMFAGNTETLGYAAKALMLGGRWSEADCVLDEAQALADRIHEHAMYPYLLRLRAEVALQQSRDRGRELWLESLAMARRQGAPYDQMKALVSLCKHGLAGNTERDALRQLFGQLTQARDLPFMQRAAGFLA